MTLFTAVAIYFIIWWTVLFAILPFMVRNQPKASTEVEGADAGAPLHFPLKRTFLITTCAAALIWLGVFLAMHYNWLPVARYQWNAS